MAGVSGQAAVDALSPAARERIGRAGAGRGGGRDAARPRPGRPGSHRLLRSPSPPAAPASRSTSPSPRPSWGASPARSCRPSRASTTWRPSRGRISSPPQWRPSSTDEQRRTAPPAAATAHHPSAWRRCSTASPAVYDGMNLAISGFQEPRWRRHAVRETRLGPGGRALDVACGTGKVTRDLWRAVQPGGSALGVDFSEGMIGLARDRCRGRREPALRHRRRARPARRGRRLRRRHHRLRHAQPGRLPTGLRRDGSRRATGRPRRLPRDRPAHESPREAHRPLVRLDRAPHRAAGGPGERLRLPRAVHEGLPDTRARSRASCVPRASRTSTGTASPSAS